MPAIDTLRQRLYNQYLLGGQLNTVAEVVSTLTAVQSQDFNAAVWAVCQRTRNATAQDFLDAFARGDILRTHVLRPTWHFVMLADIRWLVELTGPRLLQSMAYYFRQSGLDERTMEQFTDVIQEVLADGKEHTRAELAAVLAPKIDLGKGHDRLMFGLLYAEAKGIICSGAPHGKQQTYALLAKRAPKAKVLDREAALAELAKRYFASHGPATIRDYAWWSGLTMADAKAGLRAIQHELTSEEIDGQTYWFVPSSAQPLTTSAHLLPNYDEYIVAYTDRNAIFDPTHLTRLDSRQNPLFNNTIILNGQITGLWKRKITSKGVVVDTTLFRTITPQERAGIQAAAKRYAAHLQLPLIS